MPGDSGRVPVGWQVPRLNASGEPDREPGIFAELKPDAPGSRKAGVEGGQLMRFPFYAVGSSVSADRTSRIGLRDRGKDGFPLRVLTA